MERLARLSPVLLVLTAVLLWSTGAYANTLSWSITGADETGSGSMTAINEGGGIYLVTGMTGTITVNGTKETITGFTPFTGTWTPGAYDVIASGVSGLSYSYDDVVDLSTNPEVDSYGLVFSLSGFSQLINVCSGGAAGCDTTGTGTWFDDNTPASIGNPITFSAFAAPEPSTAGLLALGLLGLTFVYSRRRLGSC